MILSIEETKRKESKLLCLLGQSLKALGEEKGN